MALDSTTLTPWAIKGELILNCNCTVFCPCVVSLGKHAPTEGYCQAWSGVRIDSGHYGDTDLSGLNIGLVLEIPGLMARGNWKAAAFIDDRSSDEAYDALVKIFSGQARGTTGLSARRSRGRLCPCLAIRAKTSSSQIPNTGWARISPLRRRPKVGCGRLAGFGILTDGQPKSARSIGAVPSKLGSNPDPQMTEKEEPRHA